MKKSSGEERKLLSQVENLADEWHPALNGDVTPRDISTGSNRKAYWKCSVCGNEWCASVKNRMYGAGCPLCARLKNAKHILTEFPSLTEQWNAELNNLSPSQISIGSRYQAYWTCTKCGHTWKAMVKNRCKGSGCPVCSGKIVVDGINDLATRNPLLTEEWDYTKNGPAELRPNEVSQYSNKKVWWVCSVCGNSWQASIASRSNGSGCKICARKLVAEKLRRKRNGITEKGKLLKTERVKHSGGANFYESNLVGTKQYKQTSQEKTDNI